MTEPLRQFELVVRKVGRFTHAQKTVRGGSHPFEERNIYSGLPAVVRDLFDNGHFAQATFEAYKFLDKEVQRYSGLPETGYKLMMRAFDPQHPLLKLNALLTKSEQDEQNGYQFVFAGSVLAIRNPRGHEFAVTDSPDTCLDHLSLASLLLRRLADAGF